MSALPERKRPASTGLDRNDKQENRQREGSTARNMLPPGSKFCQCSGCRAFFTAPSSFDAHRVGKYEITSGPDRRRCLSIAEMRLSGWRQTPDGYWTDRPAMPRVAVFARPARVGDAIGTKAIPANRVES